MIFVLAARSLCAAAAAMAAGMVGGPEAFDEEVDVTVKRIGWWITTLTNRYCSFFFLLLRMSYNFFLGEIAVEIHGLTGLFCCCIPRPNIRCPEPPSTISPF
jgi:hypothetical protein